MGYLAPAVLLAIFAGVHFLEYQISPPLDI